MNQDQWNALQGQLQRAGTSEYKVGHNFGAGSVTAQNDLSQYLNQLDPTQAINAGTVATPEQYAQMSAIQQLLGSKNPQGNAINPLNASLAGTYNPNSLNQFNYNAALGDTTQFADQSRQQAQDMATGLTSAADLAHAQSQHGGGLLNGIKQTITHPGNALASLSNPLSWGANLINLSKGQGVSPTNINPFSPSTQNQATPLVNNTPTQIAATALGNPTLMLGAAHGGEVKDIKDYLDKKDK